MSDYDRFVFGKKLKELRKKSHFSQTDLANKIGVSQNTISQWENGVREPDTIAVFLKLASILNVTLDELVNADYQTLNHSFSTAEEAMRFILQQPLVADFGGYDLDTMSDEEIIEMAEEVSEMLKIMAKRHRKK